MEVGIAVGGLTMMYVVTIFVRAGVDFEAKAKAGWFELFFKSSQRRKRRRD